LAVGGVVGVAWVLAVVVAVAVAVAVAVVVVVLQPRAGWLPPYSKLVSSLF